MKNGARSLAQTQCVGLVADCDRDGIVSIGDLIAAVRISLGNADLAVCSAADSRSSDGRVSVHEYVYRFAVYVYA